MTTAATPEERTVPAGSSRAVLSAGPRARRGAGLGMALVSAATFGTSGTFGDALLHAGWSPGAAVLARNIVAALVLTPPALAECRGRWGQLRRNARTALAYGLVGVIGCQLAYFYAIQSMDVGVALLLEFCGAIMVTGWLWARHGQRPRRLTMAGAVASVAGLAMMAGVTGSGGISAIGFMWGMLAAVSMAAYFFLSDGPAKPGAGTGTGPGGGDGAASPAETLSPVVLSWAGICVGAVVLAALGLTHVLPLAASTRDVVFLSYRTSWVVPVIGIGLLATAAGYTTGVAAVRYLGPKLASFIGMSEVLFAAVFAWMLLRQVPTTSQFIGGAFILAGLVMVRIDES